MIAVDTLSNPVLGARTWWDSSQYRRLGMEQKDPWKQVFEPFFKKDDILFDLLEDEIRTIVVRLCKDCASAIEEHLKLILDPTYFFIVQKKSSMNASDKPPWAALAVMAFSFASE